VNSLNFISPQDVKDIINRKDDNYMLIDIRDEYEFNDWNIKGSVNVPINKYIASGEADEAKSALSSLNLNKKLIIICMRGTNSQLAASLLDEMRYDAYVMTKGMQGWNENFDIHEIPLKSAKNKQFTVVQFIRIGKGCLSYIVFDEYSKESAIIDPSIFIEEYINYINEHNLKPKYIIDTHAHADHFSGGKALEKTLNVGYYVNKNDMDKGVKINNINDNSDMRLGNMQIALHNTPGHTDGSFSLLIGDMALFCGDLLLPESVGRPDLARNQQETIKGAEKLYNTINSFILKLDNEILVFPAHYTSIEKRPVTLTIEELKKYNDSLTISGKQEFIGFITSKMPKTPPNFQTIKKFNKSGTIIPLDYAEDLEIGPNRCSSR